jgi:hypothetical protein
LVATPGVDGASPAFAVDASIGWGVRIGPDETVWGPVCGVARRRNGDEENERVMAVKGAGMGEGPAAARRRSGERVRRERDMVGDRKAQKK